MNFWNNIYTNFDPIALKIFGFSIHWYGIMYVLALLSALFIAKWIVKKDKLPFTEQQLDAYFIWIEVGVILGARMGYILFYDPNVNYYLTHPWQMFNPFVDGTFVGIRGMSYHGALIGFLLGTIGYSLKHKVSPWGYLDLVALAVPFGYIFGRIGNFLNKELIGRYTDVPWGINVLGDLRHPSQLYEAFLEGFMVFILIYMYRKYKKFDGELIAIYGMLYALARFVAEFWREPDFQLGFIFGNWLTMGQILSCCMFAISTILYIYLFKKNTKLIKK